MGLMLVIFKVKTFEREERERERERDRKRERERDLYLIDDLFMSIVVKVYYY